jgi:hypothetical protein
MFLFAMALEIADLALDWDFFDEIKDVDLIADEIRYCILGFAILGTVLFLGTVLNKCVTICDDGYEEEEDRCGAVLSLLSTVFEDLPQIILALIVAFNTTDLLSPVQIAKAVYGIIEPIIQIALNGREYSKLRKNIWDDNTCAKGCKIAEIIANVIVIICSVILLVDLVFHL